MLHPSVEGEPKTAIPAPCRPRFTASALGLFTAAAGAMVLVGWLFNIPSLKSVLPGFVTMKANTAAGFVLVGGSLALLGYAARHAMARPVAMACASLTALLGLLTVYEYLSGFDLGIDQLLFREPAGAVGTLSPGRMAPASAINFFVIGCALVLAGSHRTILAAQRLALLTGLMALLPLIGYLYGARELLGIGHYTQMAVHTAILFVLLGLGVLLLHPGDGLMRTVTANDLGGMLLRRLWPLLIGVPLMLGWLRVRGERKGYFDSELGVGLMMIVMMVLFTSLVWWSARTLSRADALRRQAEKNVRDSEVRYRTLVDNIRIGVTLIDRDYRILVTNPAQGELFHKLPEAFAGKRCFAEFEKRDSVCSHCPGTQALATGRPAEAETDGVRDDGSRFSVRLQAFPIMGPDGRAEAFIEVVEDVTDRKQVHDALRDSEARFSAAFRAAPISIAITRLSDGQFVDVNEAWCSVTGISRQEAVSRASAELGVWTDRAIRERLITELRSTGVVRDLPLQLRHTSGAIRDMLMSASLLELDGSPCMLSMAQDVTDKKQAEKALHESEQRFRQLIEQSADGVFLQDLNGRFVEVNARACECLGYTREELLTMGVGDIESSLSPEATAQVRRMLGESPSSGPVTLEGVHRRKDGSTYPVEARVGKVQIGQQRLVLALVRDITARKQREAALRESEQRYRCLFQNMLGGFAYCQVLFDDGGSPVDFVYLEVNTAFATLTGLGDVVGRKATELFPGILQEHPELLQTYGRVATTGQPEKFEFFFKPLSAWLSVSAYSPNRGYFVAVFDDITERKESEAALRESENRFRQLTEQSVDTVFVRDFDGQLVDVNQRACESLGYSREELLSMKLWEVEVKLPREQILENSAKLKRLPFPSAPLSFEGVHRRKDGSTFCVEARSAVIEIGGRRLVLSISRDVTARKQAEAMAMEQAGLKEAVRGMEQVLGVVGHELRSPLAGIRALAEVLLMDGLEGEQQATFVQSIHDEVVRMAGTINDLLEAARLNSGHAKWNWGTVDIDQACAEAVESVGPLVNLDAVSLISRVEPPGLMMSGDADAVRRLLVNLLSNAAKHTRAGQIMVQVVAEQREGHAWVRLSVSDTGEGIAPELVSRLGEAFALNSGIVGSQHVKGTGLGLAISKGIAAAHGGWLTVESTVGRGTTISAVLRADLNAPVQGEAKVELVPCRAAETRGAA